jgi:hypothetical protein
MQKKEEEKEVNKVHLVKKQKVNHASSIGTKVSIRIRFQYLQ